MPNEGPTGRSGPCPCRRPPIGCADRSCLCDRPAWRSRRAPSAGFHAEHRMSVAGPSTAAASYRRRGDAQTSTRTEATGKRRRATRLGWPGNVQRPPLRAASVLRNRRRPTLPGTIVPSTIGAAGLNFCVRNGNRCDPSAIATETVTPTPFRRCELPSTFRVFVGAGAGLRMPSISKSFSCQWSPISRTP